jgi:hypothetical protein
LEILLPENSGTKFGPLPFTLFAEKKKAGINWTRLISRVPMCARAPEDAILPEYKASESSGTYLMAMRAPRLTGCF